jgi:hypothetical protein
MGEKQSEYVKAEYPHSEQSDAFLSEGVWLRIGIAAELRQQIFGDQAPDQHD